MAMCLNTPAVCSAPSAFSMRNHSSLFFHWLKFPRKISGTGCKEARNRVKVGNMHITGGVYQSYSQIYNNGSYCMHQRIQTPSITAPVIKRHLHLRVAKDVMEAMRFSRSPIQVT